MRPLRTGAIPTAVLAAALLGPTPVAAFSDDLVAPDPFASTRIPIEIRARERALDAFNTKRRKENPYKWAGRDFEIVKIKQPFQFSNHDMRFEFRVPGKHGSWASMKIEF